MIDFFEIDFLDVESDKSGDAIPLRYQLNETMSIHVVDGGFQDTGKKVIDHIRQHYGNIRYIDRVVVTHPDGDHTGGLKSVLDEFEVGALWMLRPWLYANEIINRFSQPLTIEELRTHLKEAYSTIVTLEEIALKKGIPMHEPFQGAIVGAFTILAPSKARYLDLIVESEKTPQSLKEAYQSDIVVLKALLEKLRVKSVSLLKAAWGSEVFSTEGTSAENEMSVVQYANLCGKRVLLTGDAGRAALTEAADYALHIGLTLPGIDRFQVPHHGSRRNVSTEVLDRWLGPPLPSKLQKGEERFTAVVSSAKNDKDHPRKSVVRAFIHRGGQVFTTEGASLRTSYNAPERAGWNPATPEDYPEEQEE